MGQKLKISVLGNEISSEGLRRILSDRGLAVRAWQLAQLTQCLANLPDRHHQLLIVDAASNDAGIAICRSIRDSFASLRLVMICDDCSPDLARQICARGVDRAIARAAPIETLFALLEDLADGPLCGDRVTGLPAPTEQPFDGRHFSTREIEMLFYLANGDSNKVIASYLGISEAVVKAHVKSLLRKLSLKNRTQAAIWAVQHGFVWRQEQPVANLRQGLIATTGFGRERGLIAQGFPGDR